MYLLKVLILLKFCCGRLQNKLWLCKNIFVVNNLTNFSTLIFTENNNSLT